MALHYGSKQGEIETLNYTLSHERGSERSERASERVSAAEGASEASSPEQANEWAVRANERTDERVAQYLRPNFWLIWTIVRWRGEREIGRRGEQSFRFDWIRGVSWRGLKGSYQRILLNWFLISQKPLWGMINDQKSGFFQKMKCSPAKN